MPTLAHKAYLDSLPEEWERVRLGELADELQVRVEAHRYSVVAVLENWWYKYSTTMQDIKGRCEKTTEKLDHYLEVMGYE